MAVYLSQIFTFERDELRFDAEKSILLCREIEKGAKRWIKKLSGIHAIAAAVEDDERYYLSCESCDITGLFIALDRTTGNTLWEIPGKSFINVLYQGNLYLIFSDQDNFFYLIKVDRSTGHKLWHHRISDDLQAYTINSKTITLTYRSGIKEHISAQNGSLL